MPHSSLIGIKASNWEKLDKIKLAGVVKLSQPSSHTSYTISIIMRPKL